MSRKQTTKIRFREIIKSLEDKDLKLVCVTYLQGGKKYWQIQLGLPSDDWHVVLEKMRSQKEANISMKKYLEWYKFMLRNKMTQNQWVRDFLAKQAQEKED